MRIKALVTAIFLSSIIAGFAQEKKGIFSGSVKASATKLPLYEAVVTLSSPVLEGKKYAVTDSTGVYRITNLPKGTYSITIEMEGFDTITYDNIFLPEGMSQGVSVEMRRMRNAQNTRGDNKEHRKQKVD
ncbi:MAG TPA: carboxypeptidase-like regulatory domain-containing protein [Segetibacter sp.]|jgi:hypothetical protein